VSQCRYRVSSPSAKYSLILFTTAQVTYSSAVMGANVNFLFTPFAVTLTT
jgi:hypothetical protein